jgi:hypothetical protein
MMMMMMVLWIGAKVTEEHTAFIFIPEVCSLKMVLFNYNSKWCHMPDMEIFTAVRNSYLIMEEYVI